MNNKCFSIDGEDYKATSSIINIALLALNLTVQFIHVLCVGLEG